MGAEDRDWYRDWWRKRSGYAERAAFRVSLGFPRSRRDDRSRWERFVVPGVLWFLALVVVVGAVRLVVRLLPH